MRKREIYSYENPEFGKLKVPMREVVSAYGDAEKFFAAIKEVTWSQFGFKALTDYIHALEHMQPNAVDEFKQIMAEIGLPIEYPSTDELDISQFHTLDDVFEVCANIINNTEEKLCNFVTLVDREFPKSFSLARKAENLIMQNSETRKFVLEAWEMWDSGVHNNTTFDNWIEHHAPYKHTEK